MGDRESAERGRIADGVQCSVDPVGELTLGGVGGGEALAVPAGMVGAGVAAPGWVMGEKREHG